MVTKNEEFKVQTVIKHIGCSMTTKYQFQGDDIRQLRMVGTVWKKALGQSQLIILPLDLFSSLDMVTNNEAIKVQTYDELYWLGCET